MNGASKSMRGVTMTELLVVLLIIALLATIAVPVYLNRIEDARIRTAQLECRELAEAEDACAAIHSFYVALQVLDDVPTVVNQSSDADDISSSNYSGVAPYVIKPTLPLGPQVGAQLPINNTTNVDIVQMRQQWQGPFVTFNRYYKGSLGNRLKTSSLDSTAAEVKFDLPLDPWGQPYRVFSPNGITGSASLTALLGPVDLTSALGTLQPVFDLILPTASTGPRGQANPYDRWAVVSYGPNQTADLPSGPNNDDIAYQFGLVPPESGFTPGP